jgi:hypothetical protein
VNGKQAYILTREVNGKTNLLIRESLMNSILNAIQAQDNRGLEGIQNSLRETIRFVNAEFQKMQAPRLSASKYLVITPEVIRRNYGIARTIGILAAFGYKVFVREDETLPNPIASARFYQDYHLQGLVEGRLLMPVKGDDAEVKQQMTQAAKKQLTSKDLIVISIEGEYRQGQGEELAKEYSHLILEKNLLGYEPNRRADYPVLLLAAALREQPEDILKLGNEVITSLGANQWVLHQTPASLELSDMLVQELANYHAIAKTLAQAA